MMTIDVETIGLEAMKLSASERAWLANRLLSSLNEHTSRYSGINLKQIEEANKRFGAYARGKMKAQPADEVIEQLLSEKD